MVNQLLEVPIDVAYKMSIVGLVVALSVVSDCCDDEVAAHSCSERTPHFDMEMRQGTRK